MWPVAGPNQFCWATAWPATEVKQVRRAVVWEPPAVELQTTQGQKVRKLLAETRQGQQVGKPLAETSQGQQVWKLLPGTRKSSQPALDAVAAGQVTELKPELVTE